MFWDKNVYLIASLRDDAQVGADEGQVQAADVLPLEGERAAVQVVEPLDELDDGGLPATCSKVGCAQTI